MCKYFGAVILILFSRFIFSQDKFPKVGFGISIGTNKGNFNFPDNTEYLQFAKKSKSEIGNNFGIITRFQIFEKATVETGLNYYKLKSKSFNPELIFEDDFIVIDNDNIYNFDGKLFLNNSEVNFESLRIPIQLNINLLNSEKFNIFLFGGIFKDFVLSFKYNSALATIIQPQAINAKIEEFAKVNFNQNVGSLLRNYNLKVKSDKEGFGFNFGFGVKFKKVEISLDFNRPENTLNQGAIYRFNSTSLNLRYFIKN